MHIVEPEIYNDELYYEIIKAVKNNDVNYCLEIGASTGEGSTKAFYEALKDKPNKKLVCIEAYKDSFNLLKERYKDDSWVKCLNVCSVPGGLDPEGIKWFMSHFNTNINRYQVEFIIGVWNDHQAYMNKNNIECNGLEKALAEHGQPDLVLIDGSPFTGLEEFELIRGAKHIFLDDIVDIKCFQAWDALDKDPNYVRRWININLRNGAAYYERIV